MLQKLETIYSPNFSATRRHNKDIKFIIIHYTGMKSEKKAISRLASIQSRVACHFFIKFSGKIIFMVPEYYAAWHAGKSNWKKYSSLNKHSIGIEISNRGHKNGYTKFNSRQLRSLYKLLRYLIKKFKINKKNILGHSDIAPDRKKDPGEKFPWKDLYKNNLSIWHKSKNQNLKNLRFQNCDKEEKQYFFKFLKKFGYSKKAKKLNIILAFQRRFRPKLVNGLLDKECYYICKNLKI